MKRRFALSCELKGRSGGDELATKASGTRSVGRLFREHNRTTRVQQHQQAKGITMNIAAATQQFAFNHQDNPDTRPRLVRTGVTLAAVLAGLVIGATSALAGPKADRSVNIRPIEDFLEAQGKAYPPPFNYTAWIDPEAGLLMAVDFAGLTSQWLFEQSGGAISLATQIEGTVIERPLADGRAEVTVLCHTRNAAITVVRLDDAFLTSLLGHDPFEMLAGAEPALGESFLKYVFINNAPGDPLPDLLAIQEQDLIMDCIVATGTGPLSEAFGVPDGTPGRAQMTQVGLWQRTSGKGATADHFPVEHIKLHVLPH
jgi:hypothetical protein